MLGNPTNPALASHDNVVEDNVASGNTNGIVIGALTQGNLIRRNLVVGNPPVQISVQDPTANGVDIKNEGSSGANTFEDNRCLTFTGSEPLCPNVGKPGNGERTEDEDVAAFGRQRLALPHARLVGAVFNAGILALPSATGAAPARHADSDVVTVTGKVVDAACYMLHVAAAMSVSHMECGTACLARGVPLAIATDDGVLYFPADGNQQLKTLLNARVRASGPVVEKHDPMELKMPVGDKNRMVVRVEGGYKQITIQRLEKIPLTKRRPA